MINGLNNLIQFVVRDVNVRRLIEKEHKAYRDYCDERFIVLLETAENYAKLSMESPDDFILREMSEAYKRLISYYDDSTIYRIQLIRRKNHYLELVSNYISQTYSSTALLPATK